MLYLSTSPDMSHNTHSHSTDFKSSLLYLWNLKLNVKLKDQFVVSSLLTVSRIRIISHWMVVTDTFCNDPKEDHSFTANFSPWPQKFCLWFLSLEWDNQRTESLNNIIKQAAENQVTDQASIHESFESKVFQQQDRRLLWASSWMICERLSKINKKKELHIVGLIWYKELLVCQVLF